MEKQFRVDTLSRHHFNFSANVPFCVLNKYSVVGIIITAVATTPIPPAPSHLLPKSSIDFSTGFPYLL